MTEQPTRRGARLRASHVDVAMLLVGAVLITLAVGAVDWRAGIFVAGAMLLAAAILGRLLTRTLR